MKPKTNDIWILIDESESQWKKLYKNLCIKAAFAAAENKGRLVAVIPYYEDASCIDMVKEWGVDSIISLKGPEYDDPTADCLRLAFFHLMNIYAPAGIVLPDTERGKNVAEKIALKLKTDSTVGYAIFGVEEEEENVLWNKNEAQLMVSNTSPFVALYTETEEMAEAGIKNPPVINEEFHVLLYADEEVIKSALCRAWDAIKALKAENIIVSGGKGLASKDNFYKLIPPLREALSADIGSSRAAVDSGWVPYEYQIGKTSRIVAPDLYVACGISGSIQHKNGMSGSKFVFAVNNDYNAPIFEIAKYGIVGDVKVILPLLTEIIADGK